MINKYRINTNYNDNERPIFNVIMDLINGLNMGLKASMMNQSKSDEEVKKILNNPEGIIIEELQVIDMRTIDEELREKVRNELNWSYRYLSAETAQLIATRNTMGR